MRISLGARHDFLRRYGIADSWRAQPLGDLARVVGGGTPSRDESRFWLGGTIPWATPSDVTANQVKYISKTAECITEAGLASSAASLLPPGSILYTSRATIGAKAIATVPIATNQGFASFLPRTVEGEYLYYLLDLLTPIIKRLGAGTTFDEVSKRDIRTVWCALPSDSSEQAAIARLLDAVDMALECTRAAVERARELKRALMQDLLPPWIGLRELTGSQKPAGVEEIVRADVVADVCNGSTPSRLEGRYWRQGTIPWLRTGKVHDRIITAADEFVTEAALRECSIRLLPRGTALVGMIGQGRTRGMSAYLDIGACINQNFGAFTPKPVPRLRVWGRWLFYYLDFHYSRVREVGGGTNQGALNCYLLKRLRLPLPALDRQKEVAAVLEGVESLEKARLTVLTVWGHLKNSLMHEFITGRTRVASAIKAAAS